MTARHFDVPEVNQYKGSMSVVDFIVDYPTFDLFIEVKDPDDPNSTHVADFAKKLKNGKLLTSLARKYRDSWIYRWAEGRGDKPTKYAVLLQFGALDHAQMIRLADQLGTQLPKRCASTRTREFVDHVAFFTMTEWNRFGRYGQVERISASGP